jgi:hypothetical protein
LFTVDVVAARVFRPLLTARGCQTQVASMNQDVFFQVDSFVRLYVISTLWKLLGAVAIWVIGGWAISQACS